MSWLALFFALEVGVLPTGYLRTYEMVIPTCETLTGCFYTDMEAEIEILDLFFIGGATKMYMDLYENEGSFKPNTVNLLFTAGIRAQQLEIGFRHYCLHPVVPWIYSNEMNLHWEGAYEEIYIRLESREFRSKK